MFPNANANTNTPIILEWRNLQLEAPNGLKLLDGISGKIPSGEVCMLMGASGAGKTTLLNVLAGRSIKKAYKISGEILLNGQRRITKTWKRNVGYVEQFDLLHNFLTPNEILTYAARFKSKDRNSQQMQQRISFLMQQLGLQHIQHRRISTGISGGEKKRISIGVELIGNPPFLFLDEPTSGLDAFNAYLLVDMLQHLAKETNKSIILTVHQPRFEILQLVDKLILMAKGKIIFFGTIHQCIDYFEEKGLRIPEKTNPTDFFIDLITKDIRTPQQEQASIERVKELIERWKEHEQLQPFSTTSNSTTPQFVHFQLNPLGEIATLTSRETLDNLRNLPFQLARIIQISIFIVILGLAFLQIGNSERSVQNRIGILFFLIINVVFTTMNPYLNMFPEDRARIVRERASDSYRGWTAYFAKLISAWPTLFLVNVVYASALYWMIGLQAKASKFFIFVLIILLVALFAQTMALTVGAFSENIQIAHIAAPTILVVMVIFGGNFVNPLTLPGYLVWIYWISPVQFGFKATSQNEFTGLTFVCTPASQKSGICFTDGAQVLNYYYLYYPGLWTCILILGGIDLGIILIGMIALEFTTRTNVRL